MADCMALGFRSDCTCLLTTSLLLSVLGTLCIDPGLTYLILAPISVNPEELYDFKDLTWSSCSENFYFKTDRKRYPYSKC